MAEQTIIPPTAEETHASPHPDLYAGVVRRFWALVIDVVIINLLWFLLYVPLLLISFLGALVAMPFAVWLTPSYTLLCMAAAWIYFAWQESAEEQATFGKRWLGLYVTDEAGKRLTFRRASLRFFAKYISAMPMMLGFVLAFFTKRKQALHDLIAETLVLRD